MMSKKAVKITCIVVAGIMLLSIAIGAAATLSLI